MALIDDSVAAIFFIPRDGTMATSPLAELLLKAGLTEIAALDTRAMSYSGDLAGIYCEAVLNEGDHYRKLWLRFLQSQLFQLIHPRPATDDWEAEPAMDLISAFRRACDGLEAEAGIVLSNLWEAEEEWVDRVEEEVVSWRTALLRARRMALLYLDDDRASTEPPHVLFDQWDQLPTEHGRIYFSGTGRHRFT